MNAYPHWCLLPAGDETVASSRIRVYAFAKALQSLGKRVTIGPTDPCTHLLVQKRVTPEILSFVRQQRRRGAVIAYDVDDLGRALDYWAPPALFRQMLCLADIVTTATDGQSEYMRSHYRFPHSYPVPALIDYDPPGPQRPQSPAFPPLRVIWFGSASNLPILQPYLSMLREIRDIRFVVCAGPEEELQRFSRAHPWVETHVWTLDTFISVLQSCHLSLLVHDGSDVDRVKGINKMIASITFGVPALVSDTPGYAATARLAGVEHAVFSDHRELKKLLETHADPAQRVAYLDQAQQPVWNAYNPVAISRMYAELVDEAGRRIRRPLVRYITRPCLSAADYTLEASRRMVQIGETGQRRFAKLIGRLPGILPR